MYTANVQQQGEWWIGWIKDIPGVNCQERTYDELLDSLRGCLKDILVFVGWVKINRVNNEDDSLLRYHQRHCARTSSQFLYDDLGNILRA